MRNHQRLNRHPKLTRTLAILALCLTLLSGSPFSAQSADELRLRELTQVFFKSYEQRNINETLRWWDSQSSNLTAYRTSTEKLFADCSKIELTGLTIRHVEWDAQTAHVWATVELGAFDAKTNKALADWTKAQRVLSWRRENNEWKILREASAYAALAQKMLAAPTDAEDKQILASTPELADTELARELNAAGNASLNSAQRDFPLIHKAYRLAYEVAWEAGDKSRAATSLVNRANAFYFQADYEQVLVYGQRGLQLNKELNRLSNAADALNIMAVAHSALGHYSESQSCYQQGLEIRQKLGEPLSLADAIQNFGAWYFSQGNYEKSLEQYQQALDTRLAFRRQSPGHAANLISIGELQSNIALSYVELGSHTNALRLYEESLTTAKTRGRDDGDVLNKIGTLYKRQGNDELALKYYLEALQANERQKSQRLIAVSLNHIGGVYQTRGQFAEAIDHHQRALAIAEQIKNQALLSKTYGYLGSALMARKNPVEALNYYQKGLALSRQLKVRDAIAENCLNLASAYFELKDLARARIFSEEALELSRQVERPELRYRVHALAGRLYQALGQTEQARQASTEAILAIERLRTEVAGGEKDVQMFFESKTVPYLILADIALSQNKPAEALRHVEAAKARTLLDVLQNEQASSRDRHRGVTSEEQKHERELGTQLAMVNSSLYKEQAKSEPNQARLAELKAEQRKVRLNLEDFRARLFSIHPELKFQRGEAQPLTMAEAAELLPDEKTALLEFVVTPERVHLFVLTKAKTGEAKLRVYPLALKREELAAKTEQFRRQLAERNTQFAKLARELYGQVLKAAKADLPAQAKLLIVPDGPLWELPFQALLDERNRYLWQDHVIAYAPSLTVLREMEKVKHGGNAAKVPPSLFAIGDPALGGESLARAQSLMGGEFGQLPEARAQVEALRKFYDASRSKVFTGAAAAEATVKAEAGKFDILHFATHGILNDRNPLYSQILLAQTDQPATGNDAAKEDGLLEAWEIMQMDLRADLAVLSACETARGRVSSGEGMIGLTWALFVAGVPTTVVSQWKVRADSTADLMVEFHRQLQLTNAHKSPPPASNWKKAEALRQAALKLLSGGKFQHPFYWAGFVLVGKTG